MADTPRPGHYGHVIPLRQRAAGHSLLLDPKRRRHLAVLCAIFAVSAFGYLLLDPRTVHVQADGRDMVLQTRMSNDRAVLNSVGVQVRPGDRITELAGRFGDVLRVDRARAVTLVVDGMSYELLTHAVTIDQLLAEANVALTDRDSVVRNGALIPVSAPVDEPPLLASAAPLDTPDGTIIEVRRAIPFTILEDGRAVTSTSSRPTVAQALREAGVVVGPGDAVTPEADAALTDSATIEVRHARAVTVALPGGHEVLYTLARTVGQALAEGDITIPDGAFVEPDVSTPVDGDMSVRLVQLGSSSDSEIEYIASSTVYTADSSLDPGETRTVEGHDGARVRRYAITYVDGEEVSRELIDEYLDPEPVDTVVYYATRQATAAPRPLAVVPAAPLPPARRPNTACDEGGSTLRVYATWYNAASAGRAASDPSYGITATGVRVTYGIVAVDPAVIPLGTRMCIPGYGYGTAADTGGAVKGYIIDLGYPDGVAVDWNSRWLDIYILP